MYTILRIRETKPHHKPTMDIVQTYGIYGTQTTAENVAKTHKHDLRQSANYVHRLYVVSLSDPIA